MAMANGPVTSDGNFPAPGNNNFEELSAPH
ncbi:predicted protein [Sclerotinia sclerotiorum 1980 UF-70]|uniref:Uncharacterized protein n=1 Tax=Sclerotinia sclerotiorum (strain ATCC 18683 / 1980 / Ss-1) TaxID=665079 RepID=A7F6F1_SCLS1|nr:predicted protein [Sclerotinia sclerotiorum 1980 UF-70]EDN98322.1 predicted protein [Sclerotinia sclerotiorum 1980 UF-70]